MDLEPFLVSFPNSELFIFVFSWTLNFVLLFFPDTEPFTFVYFPDSEPFMFIQYCPDSEPFFLTLSHSCIYCPDSEPFMFIFSRLWAIHVYIVQTLSLFSWLSEPFLVFPDSGSQPSLDRSCQQPHPELRLQEHREKDTSILYRVRIPTGGGRGGEALKADHMYVLTVVKSDFPNWHVKWSS